MYIGITLGPLGYIEITLHCVSLWHWSFTLINSMNSYEFRSPSRFLWKKDSKTSPDGSFQDLRRKFGRAKLERGQKGGHFLTVAGQTYNLRRSCRTLEIWSDGRTDLVHTEAEDGMTHDSWWLMTTHDDSWWPGGIVSTNIIEISSSIYVMVVIWYSLR